MHFFWREGRYTLHTWRGGRGLGGHKVRLLMGSLYSCELGYSI